MGGGILGVYTDDEYFYTDIFPIREDEVYVDCGAYDGDTVLRFLEAVNKKYREIVAFELDKNNYGLLTKALSPYPDITCYNYGVWDNNQELSYGQEDSDGGESICIYKSKNQTVGRGVKLDSVLKDKHVTLIKMDIEGAELRALHGCQEIIKREQPKLAICIYHRLNDFWEIPLYLKKLVPDYKIWVRHHTPFSEFGTVLYACCEG